MPILVVYVFRLIMKQMLGDIGKSKSIVVLEYYIWRKQVRYEQRCVH